jgi:hypothetical protein
MSEQPQPSQQQQPIMGRVAWSQVTNILTNGQSGRVIFGAIVVGLFIALILADRNDNAHTSRQRSVSSKSEESK